MYYYFSFKSFHTLCAISMEAAKEIGHVHPLLAGELYFFQHQAAIFQGHTERLAAILHQCAHGFGGHAEVFFSGINLEHRAFFPLQQFRPSGRLG